MGGLGLEKLHKLMPDIIQTAERTDIAPTVRDGYIMMYIYLPAVFGDDFMSYIAIIIPSILKVSRVFVNHGICNVVMVLGLYTW